MSDQIINIPGVGDIAFPDSMSEQDITAAAKRLYEGGAVPCQGDLRPVPRTITDSIPNTGPLGVVKGAAESALSTGAGLRRLIGAAGEATGIDLPGVDIGITADEYADRKRAVSKHGCQTHWAHCRTDGGVHGSRKPSRKAHSRRIWRSGCARTSHHAGCNSGNRWSCQEGDVEGGIVPGITGAVLPTVGAGLQAVGRRVMGTAVESAVEDTAQVYRRSGSGKGRYFERDVSRPISDVTPEELQQIRKDLIDAALEQRITGQVTAPVVYATTRLGTTPVIENGVVAGFRPSTEAGRIAANALARRAPVSTGQTAVELGGGAGLSMFSGNPLAALAALYRAAARHSPARTAIVTNELGRLLGSPLTSDAAAGGASQVDPLRKQLEEELRKRSSR